MDTSQLKSYAPEARNAFIAAVSAQAALLGITTKGTEDAKVKGDVLLVGGQAFPKAVAEPRKRLVERVEANGFEATMEAIAYTWFNRFVAIRYMELHGYLEHGYRVLSHPEGEGRPEILDHAADVDLAGLDSARVVELKLDGTKDEELYRLLMMAQCNALHKAMPFLFERIGDETELLLPANLLHSDSLVRKLVESIDKDAWDQIEIIGWIYQFYISEKKDEVIGKVVKSEDIPAATQLFTPNWIVKYMVQNSLGAQWLATYPHSPLKEKMEFYIEPADQTEDVQAQLDAMTRECLDPEKLTLIDPACGSGHILVEAYDLFKSIYLERGYRLRDVPRLILEKNLFGLDIDERAAQLAGFALMMKGRANDQRLFARNVTLNVAALEDSAGFDPDRLSMGVDFTEYGIDRNSLVSLKVLFEHASTFGSLLRVPKELVAQFSALRELTTWAPPKGTTIDWEMGNAANRLGRLLRQARFLAAQYDAVVANPPYMGKKGMNPLVKAFVKQNFPNSGSDLFAASMERFLRLAKHEGSVGLMTPFTWMFLSSYGSIRELVLESNTLSSLIQPQYHTLFKSAAVPVCSFVVRRNRMPEYNASFIKLTEFRGAELQPEKTLEAIADPSCSWRYHAKLSGFSQVPGRPVAYWISDSARAAYTKGRPLREVAHPRQGNTTTDNGRFVRFWWEVQLRRIGLNVGSVGSFVGGGYKWAPYNKGGGNRKWFGLNLAVVNWEDDGAEIRAIPHSVIANPHMYFVSGITWSTVSITLEPGFRRYGRGFVFDNKGACIQVESEDEAGFLLGILNSKLLEALIAEISPTISLQPGDIARMPIIDAERELRKQVTSNALSAVALAKDDWDLLEVSWDFAANCLQELGTGDSIAETYAAFLVQAKSSLAQLQSIQEENNRLLIDIYGLSGELATGVPAEQITLTVNPAYRYGGKLTEEEQWTRFRQDTMEELISYAIGCMMGRYSLHEPGLIYADSGNEGFDFDCYTTFPADDDGIVPLTDTHWFDDDACHRFVEFIRVAWNETHLEENLTFLASSLSPKKSGSSRETLRRYLNTSFFKDHLKTYKKRPIYWLFSSGKQKAFQALVYLHRYNEGTLSRMRSEYVIPLQGKIAARLEKLTTDIGGATSTAQGKRLSKEQTKLEKQQVELLAFDENLRHYADRRISLDLDDGVKVNYGKFGDLLAEVKVVHGKKPEGA